MSNSVRILSERQKLLLRYLESHKDQWVRQADIAVDLFFLYGNEEAGKKNYHGTKQRREMTKDIAAINESAEQNVLIMSTSAGIKLLSEQERINYLTRKRALALRTLSRVNKQIRKANNTKQERIEP